MLRVTTVDVDAIAPVQYPRQNGNDRLGNTTGSPALLVAHRKYMVDGKDTRKEVACLYHAS
eukprot:13238123-Heterocapsa_arctica.AAC.1